MRSATGSATRLFSPSRFTHATKSMCESTSGGKKLAPPLSTSSTCPTLDFQCHDLRHYFASLLVADGCDVKTVQARLRHASAGTTLDTYGHLWPDRDESTRAAVNAVLADRADSLRTEAGPR